ERVDARLRRDRLGRLDRPDLRAHALTGERAAREEQAEQERLPGTVGVRATQARRGREWGAPRRPQERARSVTAGRRRRAARKIDGRGDSVKPPRPPVLPAARSDQRVGRGWPLPSAAGRITRRSP